MDRDSDKSSQSDSESETESKGEAEAEARKCIGMSKTSKMNIHKPLVRKPDIKKNVTLFDQDSLKMVSDLKVADELLSLKLNHRRFKNVEELKKELDKKKNVKYLKLYKCSVEFFNNENLPPINTLVCIKFVKCHDNNIFKAFTNQKSLQKIIVCDDEWTCKEFPHEVFNEIRTNCKNLDHLVLNGVGTGSYFDSDEFPFKVTKLETSMITFNWYVGIKTARTSFLESQKGSLKELMIHELPYDFDGGKVLKYIIEEMNLETFYYGKIPLILNGQKQEIKEFEASEIQITSAYEMIRQFSCDKFTLKLSNTVISSDEIERIINPPTDIFDSLKEFEVIDNNQGHLGVFLGLFKNLRNIKKLTIRTQDRNINTILECLLIMPNLEELQLISTTPRTPERYQTILRFASNLKLIKVPADDVRDAQDNVGGNIEVAALDEANAPGGANVQRANERPELRGNRRRGDEDDENSDDDEVEGSVPLDIANQGTIEEKVGQFLVHSPTFENHNINDARKLYVHVYGYPRISVTEINRRELRRLIRREDFNRHITYLNIEEGKFVVEFRDNPDDFPNQFIIKMGKLAFRQFSNTIQLPLFTISSNLRIKICCCINDNVDWDTFMPRISSRNGLSGSLWSHFDTVPNNNQYEIYFFVDAIDYMLIQRRENWLDFKGDRVLVTAVDDPFGQDAANLFALNNLP